MRAPEKNQKLGDDVEVFSALIGLVQKLGFNGNAVSEAHRIARHCAFPGGPRRATHWLAHAIIAKRKDPIDYAIRKTVRGEDLPDNIDRGVIEHELFQAELRGVVKRRPEQSERQPA